MWELRRGEGRERERQGRADVYLKKMQFSRRVQSLRESMVLNCMNEGGGSGPRTLQADPAALGSLATATAHLP